MWGTQQLNLWPGAKVDGVFGMWYRTGSGVDRTGDVFRHANSAGNDPNGGVLVLAGDDHAAKSSTVAHQSEHTFVASGIPVLYPASVPEYLDYGVHGWAMSRYSGLWVAMKCVTDVVESSASIDIDPDRLQIVLPNDFEMPEGGLNIRWPDPPLAQEARLLNHKWYAALAYVRANKLNRVVIDSPTPRLGIMTAGKGYLDVRQALVDLSLDDETCARIGIRVLKVGLRVAAQCAERARFRRNHRGEGGDAATPRTVTERQPSFCSGCPHNTSTRVPEGSRRPARVSAGFDCGCTAFILFKAALKTITRRPR